MKATLHSADVSCKLILCMKTVRKPLQFEFLSLSSISVSASSEADIRLKRLKGNICLRLDSRNTFFLEWWTSFLSVNSITRKAAILYLWGKEQHSLVTYFCTVPVFPSAGSHFKRRFKFYLKFLWLCFTVMAFWGPVDVGRPHFSNALWELWRSHEVTSLCWGSRLRFLATIFRGRKSDTCHR